jgi:predicted  nucleic acid-binding Zn-ribbon protein
LPRPRSEIKEGVSGEMRALAEFLRELVDGCEITQKDLSRKIKISEQRLSETLRGELLPLPDVIQSIVNATAPAPRLPMMLKRAKRLYSAAETAPHTPALRRSERQVETLLAEKDRLFRDLDALRKDGALLVMFLMRVIARLDRQVRDLATEQEELQSDHMKYTSQLDELGRELWRTKQQRERASQKLETAQEQRADAEQRYITAQLEIEELQEELAKLRAEHGVAAPNSSDEARSHGRHEDVADLSDDIDEALAKIDEVLHTQAETIQRLSEHDENATVGYPSDNRAASEHRLRDDEPADGQPEAASTEDVAEHPPPKTPAEAAGLGPLHVLRLADSLWPQGEHANLAAQMEQAVTLQTPEEIETTGVLLKGLKDGHDIHSLLRSVLNRKKKHSPKPAAQSPRERPPEPSPQAGFLALTLAAHAGGVVRTCPLEDAPDTPHRQSPTARSLIRQQRADALLVPGSPMAPVPLLERKDQRERLVRALSRGRSVRLTGVRGSGRTTLLDIVAEDVSTLAPDGVVRLDGQGKSASELLYELCDCVFDLGGHRIGAARLHKLVQDIGAVVVVDDLGFGGAELGELLDATPECAFLVAATPETPVPPAESHVEEVHLSPLSQQACRELLRRSVGRELSENEDYWVDDVCFTSEGLALPLLQAGALLRRREKQPLPPVAQAAAPVAALASRVSEAARETLRIAVALGGEVPHHRRLPRLLGRSDAVASVAELIHCGLATAVGTRYRLADRVVSQLEVEGYAEGAVPRLRSVGEHYALYAGNPTVSPQQIAFEAPAILSALAGLATPFKQSCASAAVQLARSASPKFAAAGAWEAWRHALRYGRYAAQYQQGAVADRAYFHHELGLLSLCTGEREPARAALTAAVTLHRSLPDTAGVESGRRALALLAERKAAEPVATTLRLLPPKTT